MNEYSLVTPAFGRHVLTFCSRFSDSDLFMSPLFKYVYMIRLVHRSLTTVRQITFQNKVVKHDKVNLRTPFTLHLLTNWSRFGGPITV